MTMDKRNDQQGQSDMGQQSRNPQQGSQNTSGAEENPQEGDQWDNYQTRELSTEGGANIKESDLLSADDASKQTPVHREDNE